MALSHSAAQPGLLLPRGVHVAPVVGPDGETILFAVDHRHRLLGAAVYLKPGDSYVGAADELWERIERDDPLYLRAI